MTESTPVWWIYQGSGKPHDRITQLPPPPHWRKPKAAAPPATALQVDQALADRFGIGKFQIAKTECEAVNTALYLRRPLLVTGPPGTGKSTLAHAIAHELQLGKVLEWPITTRATLQDALYRYDAIGRLQEANLQRQKDPVHPASPDIGKFIRLGPLGTAFLPSQYPRVLLIDEIDKSDVDLPNDLLNIFEQGEFEIPELARLAKRQVSGKKAARDKKPEEADSRDLVEVFVHASEETAAITRGKVTCHAFPIVVMTSNGEREFPPPFLRRCIRLEFAVPKIDQLREIVTTYFTAARPAESQLAETRQLTSPYEDLIQAFLEKREARGYLANDQLLNAIYLATRGVDLLTQEQLIDLVMQPLSNTGA